MVRPHRTDGRGEARRLLDAHRDQLERWLDDDGLTVVKAHELLERQGVVVPERTLHRYALEELGIRSEEHTSELQSLMRISYAVFCLKKKKKTKKIIHTAK